MSVSIGLKIDPENRRVIAQINNLSQKTNQSIRRGLYFVGKDLTKTAKQSIIKGPKTGRVYKISGRRRKHRASAPGEPPANLTGKLQKSVNFIVRGFKQMEFGAGNRNVNYAGFLELGTKKMRKRTFLIRAINKRQKETRNYLENEIKKGLNKL